MWQIIITFTMGVALFTINAANGELVSHGTGAKTMITEEPAKIEMPPMGKGMPQITIPRERPDK